MQVQNAVFATSICALRAFAKTLNVEVGNGGLVFNPSTIVASTSDVVQFEFYPLVLLVIYGLTHAVSNTTFL
jgi:plastocyanin